MEAVIYFLRVAGYLFRQPLIVCGKYSSTPTTISISKLGFDGVSMKKILITLFCSILCTSSAFADSSVACDSACPEGKSMTSFADGNTVTCMCVDAAEMDPTVADPNVPAGEDPDNTH